MDLTPMWKDRLGDLERLTETARSAIREALHQGGPSPDDLLALREQAHEASEADLPALLAQAHVLRQRMKAGQARQLPDPDMPCFAHLRIRTATHTRDVLVGYQTFIEPRLGVSIVDWRHSFATHLLLLAGRSEKWDPQGLPFEEEWEGRTQRGVLEQRHLLAFRDGRLARVESSQGTFVKDREGTWRTEAEEDKPRMGFTTPGPGETHALRGGSPLTPVTALLDPHQVRALEQDSRKPLVILGSAGSGKTTVALHRLALLAHQKGSGFDPSRCLVVVPERGLVRLCRILLRELGLPTIPVLTYDAWVAKVARLWLGGLPPRECTEAPSKVLRFKRHPALRAMLPEYLITRFAGPADHLDHSLRMNGELSRYLLQVATGSPGQRLDQAEKWLRKQYPGRSSDRTHKAFQSSRRFLERVVEDLQLLLQDRALLEKVAAASHGDLGPSDIQAVLDHTWAQVSPTDAQTYAGISRERLRTADGRSLDAGTPDELAGSVDLEDYTLLLLMKHLKTGTITHTPLHHLVVDEAQDLAPAELAVLRAALHTAGALTVAGDPAQQVDANLPAASWEAGMSAMDLDNTRAVVLRTSYRCPEPVARFAWQLLGTAAPPEPPVCVRQGPPVLRTRHPHLGLAGVALAEVLIGLVEREPDATVVVLLREPASARRLHEVLSRVIEARLVLHGDFDFRPGVVVSTAAQVKGLEFDYTVIADASTASWPTDPLSRRLMHMAATRTIHQLWVQSPGDVSGILP